MLPFGQEQPGHPARGSQMNLQVDIYHCSNGHIHLVVRGSAMGEAAFRDFDSFSKFVRACQEFAGSRVAIPDTFLEAFPDDE